MFRIQKIRVFFFGNSFDIMNNVDFFTLEMFSSPRFRKFSKHNSERENVVFIHKQAGALELVAKYKDCVLCLSIFTK